MTCLRTHTLEEPCICNLCYRPAAEMSSPNSQQEPTLDETT